MFNWLSNLLVQKVLFLKLVEEFASELEDNIQPSIQHDNSSTSNLRLHDSDPDHPSTPITSNAKEQSLPIFHQETKSQPKVQKSQQAQEQEQIQEHVQKRIHNLNQQTGDSLFSIFKQQNHFQTTPTSIPVVQFSSTITMLMATIPWTATSFGSSAPIEKLLLTTCCIFSQTLFKRMKKLLNQLNVPKIMIVVPRGNNGSF